MQRRKGETSYLHDVRTQLTLIWILTCVVAEEGRWKAGAELLEADVEFVCEVVAWPHVAHTHTSSELRFLDTPTVF